MTRPGLTPAAAVFSVDDDPSVRTSLSRLLRTSGFEVEVFPSGEAFVARARHRGILLNSAESFAVGHETEVQAVRIALGPPATRSALEEGLTELVRMVNRVPEAYELVV